MAQAPPTPPTVSPRRRRLANVVTIVGVALTVIVAGGVLSAANSDAPAGIGGAAAGEPEAPPYQLTLFATFEQPTQIAARPGTEDLYVTQRTGLVKRMQPDAADPTGYLTDDAPVVDLTGDTETDQGGLLSLAFEPDGQTMYLAYTDTDDKLVIEARDMSADGATAESPRSIIEVERPEGDENNHFGGGIQVGPDGYLYVSVGDNLVAQLAQDPDSLFGKILRIDPLPEGGYAIPEGNPFGPSAPREGLPELWTMGLKNAYRMTFDSETDDLWATDVGVERFEEVTKLLASDVGGAGVNLGWPTFEGTQPFVDVQAYPSSPPKDPTFEYHHGEGRCAIIGGVLYRGAKFPDLVGQYLFSDLCSTALFGLESTPEGGLDMYTVAISPESNVLSVDAVPSGDVFVSTIAGPIFRLTQ